jgi:hypothetical protein
MASLTTTILSKPENRACADLPKTASNLLVARGAWLLEREEHCACADLLDSSCQRTLEQTRVLGVWSGGRSIRGLRDWT